MLEGFFRIDRNEQPVLPDVYTGSKGETSFSFYSEIPMEEAQLTDAMDIICGNASKGINGNVTAREVWEKCFPTLSSGYISIESPDEGESWIVWICT